MSHHDDDDCPFFWMWLLDGLPLPVILVIVVIVLAIKLAH